MSVAGVGVKAASGAGAMATVAALGWPALVLAGGALVLVLASAMWAVRDASRTENLVRIIQAWRGPAGASGVRRRKVAGSSPDDDREAGR